MPDGKVRVVFDCNIFVQAMLTPQSAAAACVDLARAGEIVPFISAQTLSELKEVLERPGVLKHLPHATPELRQTFLEDVIAYSLRVRHVPEKFVFARDPKDEPYINLAIEAEAQYLVSRDRDLLDLMTGHTDECKDFRRRFRSLKVLDPQVFLREMAQTKSAS